MTRWEYLEVFRDLQERDGRFTKEGKTYDFVEYINTLGEQGWELVTSYTFEDFDHTHKARYTFKRPRR